MSLWAALPRQTISKSKSSNFRLTSSTLATENFLAIALSQGSSCSKASKKLSFLAFFCWFSFTSIPLETSKNSSSLSRAEEEDILFFISLFLIFLYVVTCMLPVCWLCVGCMLAVCWLYVSCVLAFEVSSMQPIASQLFTSKFGWSLFEAKTKACCILPH